VVNEFENIDAAKTELAKFPLGSTTTPSRMDTEVKGGQVVLSHHPRSVGGQAQTMRMDSTNTSMAHCFQWYNAPQSFRPISIVN
jgi:hypothetical protein